MNTPSSAGASESLLRESVLSRRTLFWAALVGLVGAGAYQLLRGGASDEAEVTRTLEAVLADVRVRDDETPGPRDQRIQQTLARYFTDPVTLRFSDLPQTGVGQRALLIWGRLLGKFRTAELVLLAHDVSIDGSRALCKLDVRLEARDKEGVFTDQRSAEVVLVRQGEAWKIESIDVAPRAAGQPEARP